MNDISIDLETLSTRPDAAILSIGATQFDRETGAIGRTMYVEIDLDSAIKHGHVSGDTLAWWVKQDAAAMRLFRSAPDQKASLPVALDLLAGFVRSAGDVVWGNGASFDVSILESAFNKAGMEIPWKFWNIRDMRTIVEAAQAVGFDKAEVPFEGTPHHALHDSSHQARVISAAWKAITQRQEEMV